MRQRWWVTVGVRGSEPPAPASRREEAVAKLLISVQRSPVSESSEPLLNRRSGQVVVRRTRGNCFSLPGRFGPGRGLSGRPCITETSPALVRWILGRGAAPVQVSMSRKPNPLRRSAMAARVIRGHALRHAGGSACGLLHHHSMVLPPCQNPDFDPSSADPIGHRRRRRLRHPGERGL